MYRVLVIVLLVIALYLLVTTKEPENLKEVKARYEILRKNIGKYPKFAHLERPILITGFGKLFGEVGYNMNKGHEIGLCTDGTANDMFHVLIHELAHSTVKEYQHNAEFWANVDELRSLCVELGIYEEIRQIKDFCGQTVKD